jgi:hypothetical protein
LASLAALAAIAGRQARSQPARAAGSRPLAVASKHRPRLPARPAHGRPWTTFVVRYRSSGGDGYSGDQIHLFGPRRTRCAGPILGEPTGELPGTQTIYLTPGARPSSHARVYHYSPYSQRTFRPKRLSAWCPGYYHGTIRYEIPSDEVAPGDPSSFLVVRFWFYVT